MKLLQIILNLFNALSSSFSVACQVSLERSFIWDVFFQTKITKWRFLILFHFIQILYVFCYLIVV